MAGMVFCFGSSAAPSWQCERVVFSSSSKAGNGLRSDGLHSDASHPDRKQFWEDLFSSPSELWDDRLVKRSPVHPGFRYKVAVCHWVKQPMMLTFRPGHSDAQLAPPTAGDESRIRYEEGQLDRALDAMWQRDQHGIVPSVHMYKSLLKACAKRKALAQAKRVHAHIAKHELEATTILGELLVAILVKCGGLDDALELFYRLPHRTAFSWAALISGYATAGHGLDALEMYCNMLEEGLEPNKHTFVSVLRACTSLGDLNKGRCIHAETLKYGCVSDLYVGTCLLDMYSKCGSIMDVQDVFHRLSEHDVASWTAIIAAHAQQGQPEMAWQLYQEMLKGGVSPSQRALVGALQVCSMLAEKERGVAEGGQSVKSKALEKGKAIHANCQKKGYEANVFIGNTLVSMYGQCGSILDAQNTFDVLSHQDVVSLNAMVSAYVQQDQAEKALQLYAEMCGDGMSPNNRTFVSIIQACGMLAGKEEAVLVDGLLLKLQSFDKGKAIHAHAQRKHYNTDVFIGNTLISMYGKCGSIADAWDVFYGLSKQDVVSWTALLAAYAEQDKPDKVLQLYEKMREEGVSPNERTFVTVLQACGMLAEKEGHTKMKYLEEGKSIHEDARKKGYDLDIFVGNSLVSMYGKCGSICEAQKVFDGSHLRDVVSWTAILMAHLEQGNGNRALQLYQQMQEEGVSPDVWTFTSAIQACGMVAWKGEHAKLKSIADGKEIHAKAQKKGYSSEVFVGSTLISMYSKCGSIVDAENVFDELCHRSMVAWNAILTAYVDHGEKQKTFWQYEQMQEDGVSPNCRTFVTILQACGMLVELEEDVLVSGQPTKVTSLVQGRALHAAAWSKGYTSDILVVSSLITMYGKCGSILDMQNVFDEMSEKSVVPWTALLAAYVEKDQAERALELYRQMQDEGLSPVVWTLVTVLQACGTLAEMEEDFVMERRVIKVKYLEQGKAAHVQAWRRAYDSDIVVGNTLVSMYAKCGSIADAWHAFDVLPQRDVVSWTAMLTAYVQQGEEEQALELYRQMQQEGASPDDVTLVCVLQACSNMGNLEMCQQIYHSRALTEKNLSTRVANTLIHAFARSASMADAWTVFKSLTQPDVVSWTALIAGYARQGDCAATLQCYEKMKLSGVKPNGFTFLSLLSACSHSGLVDEGLKYFESMSKDHGIVPQIEHYVSMVDLLGRAGNFTGIEDLLSDMPMQPDLAMWLCLLGACQKHGRVALGKQAFDRAVHLEPKHSAAYILMFNIYADAGLWELAEEVKDFRQRAGAWKKPGQSWVEHDLKVHTFVVGDCKHAQPELYMLLREVNTSLPLAS